MSGFFIPPKTKPLTFPRMEDLVVVSRDYDNQVYHDGLFAEHRIPMPERVQSSVVSRKAEYFAGRFVAREALGKWGMEVLSIGTGERREPLWPPGVVASITHTKSLAACAAGLKHQWDYVGIDVENLIKPSTADNVRRSIINEREEQILLQQAPSANFALTLAFSAKESIFKAFYPYVGRYFDFSAARVTELNVDDRQIALEIVQNLSAEVPCGLRCEIDFWVDGSVVATLLAGRFSR